MLTLLDRTAKRLLLHFFLIQLSLTFQDNVEGDNCGLCKAGFYNLRSDNPHGCDKCYCSGVASYCSESRWMYDNVRYARRREDGPTRPAVPPLISETLAPPAEERKTAASLKPGAARSNGVVRQTWEKVPRSCKYRLIYSLPHRDVTLGRGRGRWEVNSLQE